MPDERSHHSCCHCCFRYRVEQQAWNLSVLFHRRCKLIVHLLNLYRWRATAVVKYYCQLMMRSVLHGCMHAYSIPTCSSSSSSFGLFLFIWNESERRTWYFSIWTNEIYHRVTSILFIRFSFLSPGQTLSSMIFFFFFFFSSSGPHSLHQVPLECSDWTLSPPPPSSSLMMMMMIWTDSQHERMSWMDLDSCCFHLGLQFESIGLRIERTRPF